MAKKNKTQYICTSCGTVFLTWNGQCNACQDWGTLIEELIPEITVPVQANRPLSVHIPAEYAQERSEPTPLAEVSLQNLERIKTFSPEVNRVLGGGIVPGSIVLLGGQPGIGKSTLVLQIAGQIPGNTLYVSGEESMPQIKDRADRLGIKKTDLYLLSASSVEFILEKVKSLKPELLIIDSIQTMYTETIDRGPGSITQLKECANILMRFAKITQTPVLLIGHITKDGQLGGPKLLEHIVDVVLLFEGDRHYHFRILRGQKNRYGSIEEIGIFEMKQQGLIEVTNPSGLLLSEREAQVSGSAICAVTEGQKSMLIEVQSLVNTTVFGHPQRSPNGFDLRRMQMLLAVMEKRCGLPFSRHDVFLNITGGIKTNDPGSDIGVIASCMSAIEDRPISKHVCMAGEVGLAGEIRPVKRVENRILEAERMGFKKIVLPANNLKGLDLKRYEIQCIGLRNINNLHVHLY